MATLTIADLDNGKRDLETVDAVANSRADTTTTRYGDSVLTLAGALRRLGYSAPIPYASGLTINSGLTTVSRDGVIYAPDPSLVPFTTGAWNPEQWRVVQNTQSTNQVYQFPTLGAAQAASATLPAGSTVIVEGVSQGHVVGGEYVADGGVPAIVFQDYAEMVTYTGPASLFQISSAGKSGVFAVVPAGSFTKSDGGTRFILADGRLVERCAVNGAYYPQWFGASPDGTDSAPGIHKALLAANAAGGGTVVIAGGEFTVNSYQDPVTAHAGIFPIFSNVTVVCLGGSQLKIGNYFNGKPFLLFSGLNAVDTSAVTDINNAHFKNLRVTSDMNINYMSAGYVRRVVIEFGKAFDCSVEGGRLWNIDTTNGIASGFKGAGERVNVYGVSFYNLAKEVSDNTDHTTCYIGSLNSHVFDCTFYAYTTRMRRIGCPVELHAPLCTFKDSTATGYTRAGWFASQIGEWQGVYDCEMSGITAFVPNAAFYIWCETGNSLTDCVIRDNKIHCDNSMETEALYIGHQGIFSSSGDDANYSPPSGFVIEDNIVISNAAKPGMATAWHTVQRYESFKIRRNTFVNTNDGVVAQVPAFSSLFGWEISGNEFDCASSPKPVSENFLAFRATNILNFKFSENTFKFDPARAPSETLSFFSTSAITGALIDGFKYTSGRPAACDFNSPFGLVDDVRGTFSFYGRPVSVPGVALGTMGILSATIPNGIPFGSRADVTGPFTSELSVCSTSTNSNVCRFPAMATGGSVSAGTVNATITVYRV